MKNKALIAASLLVILGLTSCSFKDPYNIESLDSGDISLIRKQIELIELIVPLSKQLVDYAGSGKVFDQDGNTGHNNFKDEISDAKSTIKSYFNNDLIVKGDNAGKCTFTRYDFDKVIMVDEGDLSNGVVTNCLVHEGAHANGADHENDFQNWIDGTSLSYDDSAFLTKIQNYKDVPYLIDIFYDPSADLYKAYLDDIETCDYNSTTDIEDDVYLERYVESDCSEWSEDVADDIWNDWDEVLEDLGISEEELNEWVYETELCQDLVNYCEELIE